MKSSMLKKLGIGDAEAIAKHYGLTKEPVITEAQKEQINQKPSALEQSAEETDTSTE